MARLYEYQGKELLRSAGINVPPGRVARSAVEAGAVAEEIGGRVVLKAQVFVTGRAAAGGIQFAENAPAAERLAGRTMLGRPIKGQRCEMVLVERTVEIAREMYAAVIVDNAARRPVVLFSSVGGSGVEAIAAAHPEALVTTEVDPRCGLAAFEAREIARRAGLRGRELVGVADVIHKLYGVAAASEARAAEINPLVIASGGEVVAVDCRITVDDYAVFRHPELGVAVAREFDRPPTALDLIAYEVEKDDYRGTFYFVQLAEGFGRADRYVAFHGAGGGGSMMSMDAALAEGFRIANFCDTSGNPPASKVYRAARILLAQSNLVGYFGSGSGVASQEQFHSARGLVKAFREVGLDIPCVERLGGNQEERAIQILTQYTADLPAPIECYGKDTSARFCARRLRDLTETYDYAAAREKPVPPSHSSSYAFETVTQGTVSFDYSRCDSCASKVCVEECVPQILALEGDRPALNITPEEARRGRCSECLACEVECHARGNGGGKITLPIPGLEAYLKSRA
ncbi:MAG: acetate--CoA ligase family protein [Candidatus Coatesbacteria bacterium]|nr:MAG: acetate--CoA ligase family protein [Candidatus Coatesbacteria bacterium]